MGLSQMVYDDAVQDVSSKITNKITGLTISYARKYGHVVDIGFTIPANTPNATILFTVGSELLPFADVNESGARTNVNAGSTVCTLRSGTGNFYYSCVTALSETLNFHFCYLAQE